MGLGLVFAARRGSPAMRQPLRLLAPLIALFAASGIASAWPTGGVFVAPLPQGGQFEPRLLLGQQGSAFAFWSDDRWLDGWTDTYGQLLTHDGLVAPGWSDTGLMIARAPGDQRPQSGLSLSDGSFIVGFQDDRNRVPGGTGTDPYVSHELPDGRIDPTWPRQGFQAIARIADDAPRRMTWVAPDTFVIMSPYIYPDAITRLLFQSVAVAPTGPQVLWGSQGLLYQWRPSTVTTTQEILADGAGGVFVLFDEFSSPPPQDDIYLMRLGRDGLPASGWESGARPVSVAPGVQEDARFCSDGAGGMYVAWGDARAGAGLPFPDYTAYEGIRLQRLTSEGAPYPGWPADGLVVSDVGGQRKPSVAADEEGGVYVSFDDAPMAVTHVRSDGTFAPGWAKNGIQISSLFIAAFHSSMVLDSAGGVFVEFEDLSDGYLFLQHVLAAGAVDPLWPSTGRQLGTGSEGDIAPDGAGGCYAAYQSQLIPFGPSVVAVNRFGVDGVVPVKLAEGTAEAEPGRVHLTWRGAEASPSDARVQRRDDSGGEWRDLGAPTAVGRDEMDYEDLTAAPGASYDYRLVRGAEVLSQEITVRVPAAAAFALAGATPNPALARELSVSFSLAGGGAARIELFDLAGRREYARPLTGLAPGHHALSLAEAQLAPGVHWLHLSEGARSATARIVVMM